MTPRRQLAVALAGGASLSGGHNKLGMVLTLNLKRTILYSVFKVQTFVLVLVDGASLNHRQQ